MKPIQEQNAVCTKVMFPTSLSRDITDKFQKDAQFEKEEDFFASNFYI